MAGIANFPSQLVQVIQTGYLKHAFERGLESITGYRSVADKMDFPGKIGQTITETRRGLKTPVTTPSNAANNTNFDNGMTASTFSVEQYTVSLNQYNDTIDLNLVADVVGIASQFVTNAEVNGIQAAQSLDRLAQYTLFNAALAGNTRVHTAASGNTVVAVDDIRGFTVAPVNNTMAPVTATNTLSVTIGANAYTLVAATPDGTNVSTAPQGISGVLTFSANVVAGDATANATTTAVNASLVLRPNARGTTAAITSGDTLTMGLLNDAVAQLRNNAVPTIDGLYNAFLDPTSMRQLFADPDFKQLYQGATASNSVFSSGIINLPFMGIRLIATTESPIQTAPSVAGSKIRRVLVVGKGALIEGDFAHIGDMQGVIEGPSHIDLVDGIAHITRSPMDRLGQLIAQSWYWIGGFTAPTDVTAITSIIPTASSAAYKRVVCIEHLG